MKFRLFPALLIPCLFSALAFAQPDTSRFPLSKIKLPPGFQISVLTSRVPGARSLTMSPSGTLFIGTRDPGKVYAIPNAAQGGSEVVTIASGLTMPNGVAFKDGALYVAEISRILRYDGIETRLKKPPAPVVVNGTFSKEAHHGWKFIAFGPDGWLYVPVGAPCNICKPTSENFATIMRMRPDGSGLEIFASGIRNSVGFDWHPSTRELWFTDNGRDLMGDDVPPDELNRASKKGMNFGFPYCHGKGITDPEFGVGHNCAGTEFTAPELNLTPHGAALGMRFYTGKMFPKAYQGQIFIAEHGSWNRTQPIGYRIMVAKAEAARALNYEVFAEGWLQGGTAWGRPVDVLVAPDGALLVSDDLAGAIYRIAAERI